MTDVTIGLCLATSLNPTLLVTAEELLRLGVLEGAAGNDIDPDENHHRYDKNHVGSSPFFSQVP